MESSTRYDTAMYFFFLSMKVKRIKFKTSKDIFKHKTVSLHKLSLHQLHHYRFKQNLFTFSESKNDYFLCFFCIIFVEVSLLNLFQQ